MPSPAPSIQFYDTPDRQRLAARVWERPDAIADVVFLHGIVSHGGWYLSSCSHLAASGFQVHFLERRGSGLNVDNRGDVDDWQTWILDVACYMDQLPPQRPMILLGISWGGVLATAIARRHPGLIAGLGLLCPGLFSFQAANRWQQIALPAAAKLGLSGLHVPVPLRNPALFTDSVSAQRYVAQDPLALRSITVRFAIENLKLARYATAVPEEIHLPLLVVLAGRDRIVDNQRTVEFVNRVGHENKQIVQYPDASHTLEFEVDPAEYFRQLTQWCSEIAGAAG